MKCENCGACCLYLLVPQGGIDEDYLKAHDIKKAGPFYAVYSPCPQFDLTTKKCKIYENRPELCKRFKAGGYLCLLCRRVNSAGPQLEEGKSDTKSNIG